VVPRVARRDSGYGFGVADAAVFADAGCAIIVTCDCGTSDHEGLAEARRRGSAVIIVDHHQVPEREPDALALIDGDGSPRLLARADELSAMLLERAVPGTQLWALPEEEATPIAADALERFWRPLADGHPFRPLAGEAARWTETLLPKWEAAGRPCGRALVEEAAALARELGDSIEEQALLHQDFQGSNVLRSARGWLVVDPKPLAGDRAFDLASLLRDRRWELTEAVVRRRFDFLTERLGLDRARARGWGIVHALAWGMDGEHPDHLAVAGWLAALDP
ncbi:MAG TPA: aminoglycoside phosphotransferase family protein, partial [Gaiellaceae bacterium]